VGRDGEAVERALMSEIAKTGRLEEVPDLPAADGNCHTSRSGDHKMPKVEALVGRRGRPEMITGK